MFLTVRDMQPEGKPHNIPSFPEKLEKDIGNIISRNLREISFQDGMNAMECMDMDILIYEILEYVTNHK